MKTKKTEQQIINQKIVKAFNRNLLKQVRAKYPKQNKTK